MERRESVISGESLGVTTDFRTSIHKIRNSLNKASEVDEQNHAHNEKRWRLSYLKKQFESLQLHKLFNRYTERINHGYFSQFLSLQILLSTTHFILVLAANFSDPNEVLPDLIIYCSTAALATIFLFITDAYVKTHPKLLKVFAISAFIIIFFSNIFIPFYYRKIDNGHIRPAYSTHLILSSYVFLNVYDNLMSFLLGLFVSIVHIVTLILVSYLDTEMLWQRVLSDAIYLGCINGIGIYFRYMNEIVKRRSFLDRRSCVESTLQVKFEQEQESQLMSSIIPKHIIDRVKNDIITYWDTIEKSNEPPRHRPFVNPYVEVHKNVTILFADIVNYTQMTTQLNIKDLLETLNDLFGRFDDASEELKVLRIKFLGDCYYCVAGLPPDPPQNHAEACVDLGLKMISIISDVRRARNLPIDMRIGIHSGTITSGIIGSIKWQYDIWSNDVDLANKMETEGQPGNVHVTEHTRRLLHKPYDITSYKVVNNIDTYLIAPTRNSIIEEPPNERFSVELRESGDIDFDNNQRRPTIYKKRNTFTNDSRSSNASNIPIVQRSFSQVELGSDGVEPFDSTLYRQISENNEPNQRRPTLYKKRNTFEFRNSILSDLRASELHNNGISAMGEIDENQRRDTLASRRGTISHDRRFSGNPSLSGLSHRRVSVNARMSNDRRMTDGKRRTAFMNNNIKRYEERLNETNKELEETIENMLLSKYEQWFKVTEMNRIVLTFKNWKSELHFITMPDPLFKYYLVSAILSLICVFLIENLTLEKWDWTSWPFYIAIAVLTFIFLPLTWTNYLWTRHISKYNIDAPSNIFLRFFYYKSKFVTNNVIARILIYTLVCAIFCVCVLIELIECEVHVELEGSVQKRNLLVMMMHSTGDAETYCIIPWHMTETCALALIVSFLFLRMYMWIKFLYASLITAVYSYCVWNFSDGFYKNHETTNYNLKPQISHITSVVFLTLILHLIDRQTEYMNRLDHSWYEILHEKRNKARSVHAVNKMLLKNILPIHVAEIYLDVTRRSYEPEQYSGVAVMFASLVNYSTEDMGQSFLKVMNQIICDFDTLSVGNTFGRPIEKIKIAKWTYMAACGLVPGLGNAENIRRDQMNHAVISLIKFASCLMKKLKDINREGIQDMQLRVGISYGPIMAGVVGSKKPLYDIWGDPVNMASRMDTSGLPNHIQVLKGTAEIIQEFGYVCNYRGLIMIKGPREPVSTYFVALDDNFDLIKYERERSPSETTE